MRQVRLTPQALKDLEAFDAETKEKIKEALRHLAENPLDGKPLKGKFQKEKIWSYRVWPYRILYRRSDNLFVLLHAIHKTTGSIPRADIDLAHKRFADFKERMDAERRRPPRAAGSDAP